MNERRIPFSYKKASPLPMTGAELSIFRGEVVWVAHIADVLTSVN